MTYTELLRFVLSILQSKSKTNSEGNASHLRDKQKALARLHSVRTSLHCRVRRVEFCPSGAAFFVDFASEIIPLASLPLRA